MRKLADRLRLLALTRFNQFAIDGLVLAFVFLASYWIRFDGDVPDAYRLQALSLVGYVAALTIAVCLAFRVYRFVWRYVGLREGRVIGLAVSTASLMMIGVRIALPTSLHAFRVPRGVLIINFLLGFLGLVSVRLLRRITYEHSKANKRTGVVDRREARVLLIGAGDEGLTVAKEIEHGRDLGLQVCGFVDDDAWKLGTSIQGIRVCGTTADLGRLVDEYDIDHVIITLSSASSRDIRRIVSICETIPVRVRIIPAMHEILGERVSVNRVRDVRIEDLLARDVVTFDPTSFELVQAYQGRRILVTGAAGSIGSELCRQIAALKPSSVIVVDKDESGVFDVQNTLHELLGEDRVWPYILDLRHDADLRHLFLETRPEVVLHAAAFKHVPLLESHVVEAISNNVLATADLVQLSLEFGVRIFVMISTDKAVNPTSVMGATKRIAELVVQAAAQREGVRFSCVRFGNVLESRGSVVPIFKRQIARGGPVTVTHPDVTRFFMTITEATQLVLQAGSVGQKGEIFVLDMGEPVRVLDLAKDLIRLSATGDPDDIEIEIVGLRPGEKLFEQLLIAEEGTEATKFRKIFVAPSRPPQPDAIRQMLSDLRLSVTARDPAAVIRMLQRFEIGYEPNRPDPADLGSRLPAGKNRGGRLKVGTA